LNIARKMREALVKAAPIGGLPKVWAFLSWQSNETTMDELMRLIIGYKFSSFPQECYASNVSGWTVGILADKQTHRDVRHELITHSSSWPSILQSDIWQGFQESDGSNGSQRYRGSWSNCEANVWILVEQHERLDCRGN
jgi:hypothetical protein